MPRASAAFSGLKRMWLAERDLEDAVAERRRDPADEEPAETAPAEQGEQGAQEGHAAQRTVTRATARVGTRQVASGDCEGRRGRLGGLGALRQVGGDPGDGGQGLGQMGALVGRQPRQRRRRRLGPPVAPLLETLAGGGREVEAGHPAVGRVALADEHAEGEQLAHEGRDGVGGEPEHVGRLGHRDPRVAPHDAQQLVLGAGQGELRQRSAHESPRPPSQQPDRVVEVVSQAGHVLVAHVRRLRPSRRGGQRDRSR